MSRRNCDSHMTRSIRATVTQRAYRLELSIDAWLPISENPEQTLQLLSVQIVESTSIT